MGERDRYHALRESTGHYIDWTISLRGDRIAHSQTDYHMRHNHNTREVSKYGVRKIYLGPAIFAFSHHAKSESFLLRLVSVSATLNTKKHAYFHALYQILKDQRSLNVPFLSE